MTVDDAVIVLDQLAAPFPWWQLDDQAIDAWAEALVATGCDRERASQVARSWGRTNERPPSLAHFLALVRPAPEPAPVDADDAPAVHSTVVARVRQEFARAGRRIDAWVAEAGATRGFEGHWHGDGHAGCPICRHRPVKAAR